jgi:hypothetical protein
MGSVTIGLTIGVNSNLARTAVRSGRRGLIDLALSAVAVVVGLLEPGSPLPVILGSLVIGGILLRYEVPRREPQAAAAAGSGEVE